ncbi:hypothetical protein ABW19_dt0201197 [Dactylella cylindrospora]|nr:hypothetical protein ABW19_dt0201197 [Dactylella cylindrospora]
MVYYFTSNVVDPPAYIYVGKDKVENEELIKHGWEEDVWFHADKLSSAHIYLRLAEGESWENIPEDLLNDLAQLTKANSIEGMPLRHSQIHTSLQTFLRLLPPAPTFPDKTPKDGFFEKKELT